MRELTLLQRAARAYVEYTFHEHPYSATSGHRLKRTKTQRERGREEGVLATLQELVGEAIGETGYALERIIRERAVEEGLLVHEPEAVPSYRLPTTYEQAAFRKVQEKA